MAGPATGTATALGGMAAMMTFMPFGVSMETLFIGGGCFFAGSCARTGLVLIKKLDSSDPVTLQYFIRSFAVLLLTIPLAAAASCIVFLAASVLNIEADKALGGVLLIAGLRGPEGFQWLMDTVSTVFMKYVPGAKPSQGGTP